MRVVYKSVSVYCVLQNIDLQNPECPSTLTVNSGVYCLSSSMTQKSVSDNVAIPQTSRYLENLLNSSTTIQNQVCVMAKETPRM